ncbi:hypothetical protein ACFL6I_23005 [candidate division KSB1 bacterium]
MKSNIAVIIFLLMIMSLAVYLFTGHRGSLQGEVHLEGISGLSDVSSEGMRVFLISGAVKPVLDSLYANYENSYSAFIDSVNRLRHDQRVMNERIVEEEALLKAVFGMEPPRTRQYLDNRKRIDDMIAAYENSKADYQSKRDMLITLQVGYNNVITTLIDNRVRLKTEVDAQGKFEFPRVPKEDYLVYALRILAGTTDITNEPQSTYYMHALSAQHIRKLSWMLPVTIEHDSFVRLDASNMFDVFK